MQPVGLVRQGVSLPCFGFLVSDCEGQTRAASRPWMWRGGRHVGYGISEYTLVFQRVPIPLDNGQAHEWRVVRPAQDALASKRVRLRNAQAQEGIAAMLAVPICSALALDCAAYEWFLIASGVLEDVLRLLQPVTLDDGEAVETARKEIQALVMAAEVQHIVDRMPA